MRNIILMHLESLNDLIFSMNKELFPNLNAIRGESYNYKNYYSSATSTLMVMTDIAFEKDSAFDFSANLEDIYSIKPNDKTIFDFFYEQGYKIYIAVCGWEDADKPEETVDVICKNAICIHTDSIEKLEKIFLNDIDTSGQPFLLYIVDNVSHTAYMLDRITQTETKIQRRFEERYTQLDITVGKIVELVKGSKNAKATSVLFYGDHGDELWGHGIHGGYTHAIEPYMTMIKTPFFIWNGREQGVCTDLINSCDIGKIMRNESGLSKNILTSRDVVFSRNLFINQDNNFKRFNKSFAVTDGNYLLIVSGKGLEMYNNYIDYTCNNNILDFFILKKSKEIIYNNKYDSLTTCHYTKNMNSVEIDTIIETFKELFKRLEQYVKEKYEVCDKAIDVRFDKINYSNNKKIDKKFRLRLF